MEESFLNGIGKTIDDLVTAFLGKTRSKTWHPNKIYGFYEGAKKLYNKPITLLAAETLVNNIEEGDNII